MQYPNIKDRPDRPGVDLHIDKEIVLEMTDKAAVALIQLIVNRTGKRMQIIIGSSPWNLREAMRRRKI